MDLTVNLPATKTVTEIQVFRVTLKGAELDRGVLMAIDRAIPFPLIFELIQGTRIKVAAAYKQSSRSQKSEGDSSRWRIGNYFETDWQPEHTIRQPLPVALDMGSLYEQLLSPLVQHGIAHVKAQSSAPEAKELPAAIYAVTTTSEQADRVTLEQRIELAEAIASKQKEIQRIKARLGREKQFNKRVAINAELRDAKQKLERLTQQQGASQSY